MPRLNLSALLLILLCLSAPAHANFFGKPEHYPHATTPLVKIFRDGYYLVNRGNDGISKSFVTKQPDGTYLVEGSLGKTILGAHANCGDTYVAFGNTPQGYSYYIATVEKRVITFYQTSRAAKKMLGRRNAVKRMPSESARDNKKFLCDLVKYRGDFTVLYTATPVK